MEPRLRCALIVLVKLVDNGPFAKTRHLKEGHLATWLTRDDLRQVGSATCRVADEMRGVFLDNIAARAQAGRQKKARTTRLGSIQARICARINWAAVTGVTGTVAVE